MMMLMVMAIVKIIIDIQIINRRCLYPQALQVLMWMMTMTTDAIMLISQMILGVVPMITVMVTVLLTINYDGLTD